MLKDSPTSTIKRLPFWLKQDIPDTKKISKMRKLLDTTGLHTVCEEAHCPNIGECWQRSVATLMILGDTCTRECRFCAVRHGRPGGINPNEPKNVALAVKKLGLRYVVITSVTRDDLEDQGASQFVQTIQEVRSINPSTKIEVLIPDFMGRPEVLKTMAEAKPDVIGHNMETVARLFPFVRPRAEYRRSLGVLKRIKEWNASIFLKSGFMVGLGEDIQEILGLMRDLLAVGCDILTVGQYLAPSRSQRHCRVKRYVPPEEFDEYKRIALQMGFRHVMSSPLTRSSFFAEEGYAACLENLSYQR